MGLSTIYAPQRVNYKPTLPEGQQIADPRAILLKALKKLRDKSTAQIMDQSPAAVMGALTNPPDVGSGMKAGVLGNITERARLLTGGY